MHIYFDVVFFSMNYWHCTLYINRIFIKKNINKSMNLKTLIKNDKFMPEKYLQIWLPCFQSIISIINFDSYGVPFLTPMSQTNINLTYERSKFNFFLVLMATVLLRWRFFFLKSTFYYFIIIYSRKGICYFS